MTAQVKSLAAPIVLEGVKGVLHVGELKDNARGVVHVYDNQTAGDVVVLHVKTASGDSWDAPHTVTGGEARPITFAIPKEVFEKNLGAGSTASLHYTVTNQAGNSDLSQVLTIRLER